MLPQSQSRAEQPAPASQSQRAQRARRPCSAPGRRPSPVCDVIAARLIPRSSAIHSPPFPLYTRPLDPEAFFSARRSVTLAGSVLASKRRVAGYCVAVVCYSKLSSIQASFRHSATPCTTTGCAVQSSSAHCADAFACPVAATSERGAQRGRSNVSNPRASALQSVALIGWPRPPMTRVCLGASRCVSGSLPGYYSPSRQSGPRVCLAACRSSLEMPDSPLLVVLGRRSTCASTSPN